MKKKNSIRNKNEKWSLGVPFKRDDNATMLANVRRERNRCLAEINDQHYGRFDTRGNARREVINNRQVVSIFYTGRYRIEFRDMCTGCPATKCKL